jgi:1-phosphofructokinase family hexose kinase
MRIYTLTPNPSLDLGGFVENIIPNEKTYIYGETRAPGGNSINSARIIHRLGVPVVVSGFIGGGVGQELSALLKREGLSQHFIKIKGETRVGVTVSAVHTKRQTRLSFPGPEILPSEKRALLAFIKKMKKSDLLIIGGSLPRNFAVKDLLQILKLCKKKGVRTVVDCPGKILKRTVPFGPLLVKPNLIEFQEMTGKKIRTLPAVLEQAQKMLKHVPLVCVSSVEGGALLVTRQGAWHGHIPKVKIRSVVGAGDSMVGAIMVQLAKHPLEYLESHGDELLRWGLAASCATLTHTGTSLGSAREIKNFYPRVAVKKIFSPKV